MSESNCKDLAKQKDIDGFLVGGASLKPACEYQFIFFLVIVRSECGGGGSVEGRMLKEGW